jgi:hypothetical protein
MVCTHFLLDSYFNQLSVVCLRNLDRHKYDYSCSTAIFLLAALNFKK